MPVKVLKACKTNNVSDTRKDRETKVEIRLRARRSTGRFIRWRRTNGGARRRPRFIVKTPRLTSAYKFCARNVPYALTANKIWEGRARVTTCQDNFTGLLPNLYHHVRRDNSKYNPLFTDVRDCNLFRAAIRYWWLHVSYYYSRMGSVGNFCMFRNCRNLLLRYKLTAWREFTGDIFFLSNVSNWYISFWYHRILRNCLINFSIS